VDQLIDLVQMNTSPTWWEWLAAEEARNGHTLGGSGLSAERPAE
jgi:hypothetical protein